VTTTDPQALLALLRDHPPTIVAEDGCTLVWALATEPDPDQAERLYRALKEYLPNVEIVVVTGVASVVKQAPA